LAVWETDVRTADADGGTAVARVSRSIIINPFPTVEVGGVKHPTGPEIPIAVRILMVAPILLAVPFGGLVGVLVAFGAIGINYNLVRSTRRPAIKATLMALVLIAAFAVWTTVAALVSP
jgi:hypothetical protein